MPFKHHAARRRIPKARYRVRNWSAYEAGLKRRPETVPHGPMHLIIDSTGPKLFGRGEWDEGKHGRARRSWRKLHLGVDADTGGRHCHANGAGRGQAA